MHLYTSFLCLEFTVYYFSGRCTRGWSCLSGTEEEEAVWEKPHPTHCVYILQCCILYPGTEIEFVFISVFKTCCVWGGVPAACHSQLKWVLFLLPAACAVKTNPSTKEKAWEKADPGTGIKPVQQSKLYFPQYKACNCSSSCMSDKPLLNYFKIGHLCFK